MIGPAIALTVIKMQTMVHMKTTKCPNVLQKTFLPLETSLDSFKWQCERATCPVNGGTW